ncbi:MAG: peroxiredoxin [Candidatus Competibacteraceae bacterium]|nr:MAG: peroxiredoxin [Candidatus Competibacteraceae bacterium]
MSVTVGQPVPDFSAVATGDRIVRLSELRGHLVILYFYPKDNTSGCTLEGQQFRDLHDRFTALNAVVFGASRDSLRSHDRFRAQQNFPFHLIADTDQTLCQLFGVLQPKKMYGKDVVGVQRSTFLIDSEGVPRREWRKVKPDGHAAEVLAAVESMAS